MQFMCCTQAIGLVLAGGWVAISAEPAPSAATLAIAAGAGLSLTVCLAAFFEAMVVGTIAIVAPISATGIFVPVAAGIAGGERPGAAQIVGILAATAGIVLASRKPSDRPSAPASRKPSDRPSAPASRKPSDRPSAPASRKPSDRPSAPSGLALALLAALGGGLFFWLMAPASQHGAAWAVLVCRAVSASMLVATVAIRRLSLRPALRAPSAAPILASSLLAFSGIALYALATLHGQLAIVSVLGSLYPVVTLLLAYRVLGERVHGAQRLGVAAVVAGIVLLSV